MRTLGLPRFDAKGGFLGYAGIAFEVKEAAPADPECRRDGLRKRMIRSAEIILGDGQTVFCITLDRSVDGAQLHIPQLVELPFEFLARIEDDDVSRTCRVRWRRGNSIGVQFVD